MKPTLTKAGESTLTRLLDSRNNLVSVEAGVLSTKFSHLCRETPRTFSFRFPVFLSLRHRRWFERLDLLGTRAPSSGRRLTLPQSSRRPKNGGPQENLSWVFALPCQPHAENHVPAEAFRFSLYTYSGFRRSHYTLGRHRGWKNSTASMPVSSLTC